MPRSARENKTFTINDFLMKNLSSAFVPVIALAHLSLIALESLHGQSWDLNFGSNGNGIATLSISNQDEYVYDMKLDNSKRIVCVGVKNYTGGSFSPRPFVARFNTNGLPDQSFGVNGIAEIDPTVNFDYAYSLAIQPDNKIVICGAAGYEPYVARLTEAGSLDPTFGTGGHVILTGIGGGSFGTLLIHSDDGKIVAAGYVNLSGNNQDYLVVRLNSSGQKDFSFSFDGMAPYTVFDDDAPGASRIVRQSDGKYVICGTSNRDGVTTDDATVARMNSDGTMDSSFPIWASYLTGDDSANDLLVLPSGKVVITGRERSSNDYYISIKKFSSTGTLEDTDLWYSNIEDDDSGQRLALQCDGKILVLAEDNLSVFNLFRLNADYTLDETFTTISAQLSSSDHPRAMVIDGNDIFVAGYLLPNDGNFDFDPFVGKINNTSFIAAPTISITAPGSTIICPGSSITLSATGGCPTCSVEWYRDNQIVNIGNPITINTPGTYTAKYVNPGCGSSASSNAITLTAGTTPSTPGISPPNDATICVGQPYQLTVTNGCSPCTYTWSPAGTGSGQTININTAQPNTKTYTVTSNNGCPSQPSAPVIINVVPVPQAPSISPLGPVSLCSSESVTLTATNVCSGCTATWSNGQTGASIQVTSPSIYTCTVSNGACSSPASNQVVVSTLQAATPPTISTSTTATCTTATLTASNICQQCTVNWYSGDGSFIGSGNTIQVPPGTYYASATNACPEQSPQSNIVIVNQSQFDATISVNNCLLCVPNGSNYTWYFNNQIISGATGSCWTATVSGNYFVSMTDLNGCIGVTPTAFVSCVSDVQAIEDISSLRIFPNPASEHVTFELSINLPIDLDIQLFAADGQLVAQVFRGLFPTGTTEVKYPLKDLPTGTYYYRITAKNGVATGSLVIGE